MSKRTNLTFSGLKPSSTRNGLRNPERGFRFEIGVGKIPEDLVQVKHIRDQWPFHRYEADGVTMAQAYCYLTSFCDSKIPKKKLDALQADFDKARREGYKFLFRFAYEYDYNGKVGPTLDRLLAHIKQLKDIVRKNADVIYVLQTGWVGLWGEFHTSYHKLDKDPEAIRKIVEATLDMLPDDRVTMMRCMRYKTKLLKTMGIDRRVNAKTAHTAAPEARIGFFNDGTLASFWDGGTFWNRPFAAPGNPEFNRVLQESPYVPVDGELFWTGQFCRKEDADGLRASMRFFQHHYTTFSLVHGFSELDQSSDRFTIDAWKVTPFSAEMLQEYGLPFDPAYFDGSYRTAFEYIRDHLGYRIGLKTARFTSQFNADETFRANLTLENYGFAAPVNPRKPVFVFTKADGTIIERIADNDMRNWRTGNIKLDFTTDLPAGEYELAIAFPDARETIANRTDYAIRLATDMPVREANGRLLHVIGNVSVK